MNVDETSDNKIQIDNLRDKVVTAIKLVYDPEIPVDVYELGLIYEISVYPVNNVFVLMTLTSPNCPSAEFIPSEVKKKFNKSKALIMWKWK
mgnify:CR=1 FL=1